MTLNRDEYSDLLVGAVKVREKLTADTRRPNTPVRVLVLQANLLDRLTHRLERLLEDVAIERYNRGLRARPDEGESFRFGFSNARSNCNDAIADEYADFANVSER
ncbi:CIC11C00000002979 [Sungouiella intermedia]|uniref:CIC11C00000002979 n=1 Tax=Sungouiella intermedia TaxID=45354 RepID=A0A1L0B8S5_9ASCO|nr:CIC11C00000002979 [[Candida] intermedia]SGZ48994.1 CIC11C00000004721 [[Candida] intermedia]